MVHVLAVQSKTWPFSDTKTEFNHALSLFVFLMGIGATIMQIVVNLCVGWRLISQNQISTLIDWIILSVQKDLFIFSFSKFWSTGNALSNDTGNYIERITLITHRSDDNAVVGESAITTWRPNSLPQHFPINQLLSKRIHRIRSDPNHRVHSCVISVDNLYQLGFQVGMLSVYLTVIVLPSTVLSSRSRRSCVLPGRRPTHS